MKKPILFAFFTFMVSVMVAQSPIVITSTFMPSSGDTARYSNGNLSTLGNYSITGANFNWNFSALMPTTQGLRNFKLAIFTPYPFFGSGYGEKISDSIGVGSFKFTDVYNFYKKNGTTSFNAEGLGLTYSGLPIPSFHSNQDELYFFPLNYLDRDSSTFRFSTLASTVLPQYSKTGHRITEVDGWGTVTTPFGNKPCLRLVSTQYSIDSIKITIGSIPLKFGYQNYQRSYQWLVHGEKVPYVEVLGTLIGSNFTPTQVRYRDIARVGIKEESNNIAYEVFPNPVTNELIIRLPQSDDLKLEIFNLEGKSVLSKTLLNNQSENRHSINVSALSTGIYIGTLYNGKVVENFKFNKQ